MLTLKNLGQAIKDNSENSKSIIGIKLIKHADPVTLEIYPKKNSVLGKQGKSCHTYEYSDKHPDGEMSWGVSKKHIDTDTKGNAVYRSYDKGSGFYGEGLGSKTEEIISEILNSTDGKVPDMPERIIVKVFEGGAVTYLNSKTKDRKAKEAELAAKDAKNAATQEKRRATLAAKAKEAEEAPENVASKAELKKKLIKFISGKGYDVSDSDVEVTLRKVTVNLSAKTDIDYTWSLKYQGTHLESATCSTRKKKADSRLADKIISEFTPEVIKNLEINFKGSAE